MIDPRKRPTIVWCEACGVRHTADWHTRLNKDAKLPWFDPKPTLEAARITMKDLTAAFLRLEQSMAVATDAVYRFANTLYVHPQTYVRMRRAFATIEIRGIVGGRDRTGRRQCSRLPFRQRRVTALEAVRRLWLAEAGA
jgi:hypothetical protein